MLAFVTFAIRAASGGESGRMRSRSYQQVARQFSGRYISGGLLGHPTVRFRYGETFAALTETSSHGPYPGRCTQLLINWPDKRFRVEIDCDVNTDYPSIANMPQRIKSGEPEFGLPLAVRGPDEAAIRRLLSDGVRWQIARLLELAGEEHLYISIHNGQLCVQKTQTIRSFAALSTFIERALELYDQAMITQAVGIEFIENGEVAALEHVICKVCGEEIVGHEMVYCQRCKTPHHSDCWQYAGSCSVYGCLEKSYRRPKAAIASNPPHANITRDSAGADGTKGLSS